VVRGKFLKRAVKQGDEAAVIPAKAGTQFLKAVDEAPAFAGVT
jgi:hypothetical protein